MERAVENSRITRVWNHRRVEDERYRSKKVRVDISVNIDSIENSCGTEMIENLIFSHFGYVHFFGESNDKRGIVYFIVGAPNHYLRFYLGI